MNDGIFVASDAWLAQSGRIPVQASVLLYSLCVNQCLPHPFRRRLEQIGTRGRELFPLAIRTRTWLA